MHPAGLPDREPKPAARRLRSICHAGDILSSDE